MTSLEAAQSPATMVGRVYGRLRHSCAHLLAIATLAVVLAAAIGGAARAQSSSVSALSTGVAIGSTDNFYVEQGTCPGSPPACNGYKVTGAQLKTWAQSGLAAVALSGSASDLTTGTLGAALLPNPGASTLGGVKSLSCATHQWLNVISTAGAPSCSQPAAADLSNGVTGSGAVALATSPSFTTPTLGVATITTFAGLHAISSITLGASGQVGTGASAVCATGYVCDSLGGNITLTTGTGTLTAGAVPASPLFTINFADTRTNKPNCVTGAALNTSTGISGSNFLVHTETTSSLAIAGAALAASTTYSVSYHCTGN